ncbi:hypothetical protein [Allostreptomyces psammosilenae]|uniref:ATP-binding protein n=1 Tax=Allostreptomyces psammosilenae TaxID=1892865 RepID=A0A853ABN9_9ACTN|nr:hypothetical protein [Allostreptomyces psammosilenae]NYI08011.1 hypothetical protein [Allostreptomyces psammosilenae]
MKSTKIKAAGVVALGAAIAATAAGAAHAAPGLQLPQVAEGNSGDVNGMPVEQLNLSRVLPGTEAATNTTSTTLGETTALLPATLDAATPMRHYDPNSPASAPEQAQQIADMTSAAIAENQQRSVPGDAPAAPSAPSGSASSVVPNLSAVPGANAVGPATGAVTGAVPGAGDLTGAAGAVTSAGAQERVLPGLPGADLLGGMLGGASASGQAEQGGQSSAVPGLGGLSGLSGLTGGLGL